MSHLKLLGLFLLCVGIGYALGIILQNQYLP